MDVLTSIRYRNREELLTTMLREVLQACEIEYAKIRGMSTNEPASLSSNVHLARHWAVWQLEIC